MVTFSCNYLANVPEIVDLSRATRDRLPDCFIFVGGHSVSFTARDMLDHAQGAIDCVLKGEGESVVPPLLTALAEDRKSVSQVPGAVTWDGEGPAPTFVENLDDLEAARDLVPKRNKYFIGVLDPAASIEFTRGCPWSCNFCSAWTFYGRSYRRKSSEKVVEELERIQEPGIFIVDDVAFTEPAHGYEIAQAIERKGIRKKYYLETPGGCLAPA